MPDMAAMTELLSRKGNARREARGSRASEGPARAVGAAGVSDSWGGPQDGRHQSQRAPDPALRGRLRDLPNGRRRFGYRRRFVLLRREGEASGINRICRLSREEGVTVRKRKARREVIGSRAPILTEARANARWPLDLVHDQVACGRRFRVLNVVDDVTRDCLAAIPFAIGPEPVAARWLTLDPGPPRGTGADGSDRKARQARDDRQRQRDGPDLERDPEVVRRAQDRLALHRARQSR
jgi:hypothetical protein